MILTSDVDNTCWTKIQTFPDVWDAIEDTPEDAAAIRLRADVMIAITREVRVWKVTQREAARRLGVSQPRLNELLTGKISRFSLDALMALASRAGLKVTVSIRPATTAARGESMQVPARASAPNVRSRRASTAKRA